MASLFAQSGVIRTETLTAAFDVAQLLGTQPVPVGDRVAIIGNSSALGMLAVDACLDAGLQVVDGRPLDLGVDVSPDDLAAAVRAAVGRPDVDALVVVYVPTVATTGLAHAAALRSAVSRGHRPGAHHLPGRPPTAADQHAGRCRPSAPRSGRWPRWPRRCGTAPG